MLVILISSTLNFYYLEELIQKVGHSRIKNKVLDLNMDDVENYVHEVIAVFLMIGRKVSGR